MDSTHARPETLRLMARLATEKTGRQRIAGRAANWSSGAVTMDTKHKGGLGFTGWALMLAFIALMHWPAAGMFMFRFRHPEISNAKAVIYYLPEVLTFQRVE